jgi:hypothetical protein
VKAEVFQACFEPGVLERAMDARKGLAGFWIAERLFGYVAGAV